jgi:hypothetical protein
MILLIAPGLQSQDKSTILQDKLLETGFENIRVTSENNDYYISFENNIYRWNVRALSTALDTLAAYLPGNADINLVQLRFDIPQIVTKINASSWLKFRTDTLVSQEIEDDLKISYKTKKEWDKIKSNKPERRNTVRFDLVFYPQLYLTNITFEKIYEVQFNIAPALEVSFWKGMLLTAQVIFPIYNDCKVYGEGGSIIRPGFLVLSQNFRLPGPVFGNVSIGNFNHDRYGIDFNLNYPFRNPRWYIGLRSGFTGYSVFTGDGWETGDLNTFTLSASAGYFLPRFNLRFELSGGRYLQGDFGGRFDLSRMFGETTIGLYVNYTTFELGESGQPNFGFHVAIPFPPGKRMKRKRFRVDLPNYFDWEYNGATEFVYGRYYEIRPNENRTEHYFNPLYIKNELLKNRHY